MRKTLLSLTAIAALAMPGVAQARHGADDPAGHVRHHHHALHHHAHGGADDGANHR